MEYKVDYRIVSFEALTGGLSLRLMEYIIALCNVLTVEINTFTHVYALTHTHTHTHTHIYTHCTIVLNDSYKVKVTACILLA